MSLTLLYIVDIMGVTCDRNKEEKKVQTVRIAGSKAHSAVNGPGVRYVLFMQGCRHHCPGCQNPETHATDGGTECRIEDVISEILETRYLDGVTLSGGDPFAQPEAGVQIAKAVKEAGWNLWVYTGWTYEQLLEGCAGEEGIRMLSYIDVLVDGPFIEELRSEEIRWRGSTNQSLVDVQASLKQGCKVAYQEKEYIKE